MSPIVESVRTLEQRIEAGDMRGGLEGLDALRRAHPNDLDVALAWCLTALRLHRNGPIERYVEQCLPHARDAFDVATFAWLAGRACFHLVSFERALHWFQLAAGALAEPLARGRLPSTGAHKPLPEAIADGRALQAVWQAAAALRSAGVPAFPSAGTLLAIEREGRLFAFDKDVDFAVWFEALPAARAVLPGIGWQRVRNQIPYSNADCYMHAQLGVTMDMFGLHRDAGRREVVGGYWLHGKPAHYQRVLVYPWFELVARASPAGEVNWPDDPDRFLTAVYGDWRTPQRDFDTRISARNLVAPTLQVHLYVYSRMLGHWVVGRLDGMRSVCVQAKPLFPADTVLAAVSQAIGTLDAHRAATA